MRIIFSLIALSILCACSSDGPYIRTGWGRTDGKVAEEGALYFASSECRDETYRNMDLSFSQCMESKGWKFKSI